MSKLGKRLIAAAKEARANLDPIQNNCTYGYVLPDRCRYIGRQGCACGAYPPIKERIPDASPR